MLRVNLFAYDYTGYGMAYDEGEIWEIDVLQAQQNILNCLSFAFRFLQENPQKSSAMRISMLLTIF
jgi:hypothetical protein